MVETFISGSWVAGWLQYQGVGYRGSYQGAGRDRVDWGGRLRGSYLGVVSKHGA